jgi:Domain of unknown function (DUF4296)
MMLKKSIAYVIILVLVASCYKYKEPEKPKNLISKANMVKILIDLKLLSIINGPDVKVLDSNHVQVENYIYQKYQIDSAQFALSNNYYAFYVEDYEDIYNRVKDSLEALSKLYKKLEEEEIIVKKKADSLKLLIEKDSLKIVKIDSLKLDISKDSIKEIKASINKNKRLIKPISNTDIQRQQ